MTSNKSQRTRMVAMIAVLVLVVVSLQAFIDPLRRQPAIEPPKANNALGGIGKAGATLPFEYSLGAITGFRQVIAGLLWVRSDEFFHEGNYDAILPLIRLITWLDPNWLDPYSTGAWHLMYNFTDTDQRSDRRYIPAGMALLREGIENNPQIYDMYKEAGWNNFDKIKNYSEAAKYYKAAEENDPDYDVTTVGHALAHSYARMGNIPAAIAEWEKCVAKHKQLRDDPKSTADVKSRNTQGFKNSTKNLAEIRERQAVRTKDSQPPVDGSLSFKVVRIKPKVLEVSGTFNLRGAKNWAVGKGILLEGPVSGARMDVRLQDAGYTVPDLKEFTFELDNNLTIMQDSLSIRGGREVKRGGLYMAQKSETSADPGPNVEAVAVYGFGPVSGKDLGVPIDKAIAGGVPLSPLGQLQAVSIAYPIKLKISPDGTIDPTTEKQYSAVEVAALYGQLKADAPKIAALTALGYSVATKDLSLPGTFKRQIDMSKDPNMYSFKNGKFDLIVSFNPQAAPDFVQDRVGWVGEGLTDRHYLDTKTIPGVHLIRHRVELTRAQITDPGTKTLFAD